MLTYQLKDNYNHHKALDWCRNNISYHIDSSKRGLTFKIPKDLKTFSYKTGYKRGEIEIIYTFSDNAINEFIVFKLMGL